MMTDPLPPTQFDTVEDGEVVRTAAEKVRRYSAISTAIETLLVGITCLLVIGIAVGLYFVADDNQRGVDRIIGCTTEGYECYEEQKARQDALVGTFLAQLNKEHLSLKCILQVPPLQRGAEDIAKCDRQAEVETDRILTKLRDDAAKAAGEPKKKEGE